MDKVYPFHPAQELQEGRQCGTNALGWGTFNTSRGRAAWAPQLTQDPSFLGHLQVTLRGFCHLREGPGNGQVLPTLGSGLWAL